MNGRSQAIAVALLGIVALASVAVAGVCAVNRVDVPAYIIAVGSAAAGALASYIIPYKSQNNGFRP